MRLMLLAGAALALSACGGGGETQANEVSAMGENMAMDANAMLDPNMMMDQNMSMNGGATMGGNAVDANTQNMMMKDATTNDPDTNLANGM